MAPVHEDAIILQMTVGGEGLVYVERLAGDWADDILIKN